MGIDPTRLAAGIRAALVDMDRAALRAAALKDAPEAVVELPAMLGQIAVTLEELATRVHPDAPAGAQHLRSAANVVRDAEGAAQAQLGVRQLDTNLRSARRSTLDAIHVLVSATPAPFASRNEATERLLELLRTSYDDLGTEEWSELQRIAALDETLRPVGFVDGRGKSLDSGLRLVAHAIVNRQRPAVDWTGWRVLDKLRIESMVTTRDAAEERFAQLVATPRGELTRMDLHDLAGLAQLDERLRPAALRTIDGVTSDITSAAEYRGWGDAIAHWDLWVLFDGLEAAKAYPTRELATTRLREVLDRWHDMRPEDWRVLETISSLDDGLRPLGLEGPRRQRLAHQIKAISGAREYGFPPNVVHGYVWNAINAVRAELAWPTRDAAQARLAQLAATPRASLTRADLHDLDGLTRIRSDLRPRGLEPREVSPSIANAAELRGLNKPIEPAWEGWDVLDDALVARSLPENPAARAAVVESEVARALGGEPPSMLLSAIQRRRPELIALPAQARVQLVVASHALDALDAAQLTQTDAPRFALEHARAALETLGGAGDDAHRVLVDSTLELVDRNIARLDGTWQASDGAPFGYVDFAELGAIRSNLRLLEQLQRHEPSAATITGNDASALPW